MRFWFVFSLHSELFEDQVWFSLRMPAVNSWSNCKSNRNLDLLRMSLSSGPKSAGFLAKSTLRLTYSLLCGVEKWLQWCPGFLIEILGTQRFLEHIWNEWKIILHLLRKPPGPKLTSYNSREFDLKGKTTASLDFLPLLLGLLLVFMMMIFFSTLFWFLGYKYLAPDILQINAYYSNFKELIR